MESIINGRFKEGILAISLLLVFTVFFVFYYKEVGLNISFLKAESGAFLNASFSDYKHQLKFINNVILKSHNGNYTPIIFFLEFLQSKIYGSSHAFWFMRQMVGCGLLATTICLLFFRLSKIFGLNCNLSWLSSIFITLLFLCQPMMIDMVSWPFMICQLLMFSAMTLGCYYLILSIEKNDWNHINYFLFFSYLTMQLFGVGLAISLSGLLVASIILLLMKYSWNIEKTIIKRNLKFLIVIFLITITHAFLMVYKAELPKAEGTALTLFQNIERFGWLLIESCYAAIRAMWANGGFQWPEVRVNSSESIYGLGLLVISVLMIFSIFIKYRETNNKKWLIVFIVLFYSFSSLILTLAMIIFRLRLVQDPQSVIPYLIGSRYIIFSAFYIFMMSLVVISLLFRVFGEFIVLLIVVIGITSVVSTIQFSKKFMPIVWPYTQISTAVGWNEIVNNAKLNLNNNEFIYDQDISRFSTAHSVSSLKGMKFLLEHDLNCSDCVKFYPE